MRKRGRPTTKSRYAPRPCPCKSSGGKASFSVRSSTHVCTVPISVSSISATTPHMSATVPAPALLAPPTVPLITFMLMAVAATHSSPAFAVVKLTAVIRAVWRHDAPSPKMTSSATPLRYALPMPMASPHARFDKCKTARSFAGMFGTVGTVAAGGSAHRVSTAMLGAVVGEATDIIAWAATAAVPAYICNVRNGRGHIKSETHVGRRCSCCGRVHCLSRYDHFGHSTVLHTYISCLHPLALGTHLR